MQVTLITTNRHKVEQAKKIFKPFGIEIIHENVSYDEPSDDDNVTIVKKASKLLAEKYQKPIFIEDTSIFFKAYNGFPGSLAKFVYQKIGYDGIFRLLENKDTAAHFESAVGYCEPGKDPIIFTEQMTGNIVLEIHNKEMDVLPYTRIFKPSGFNKTLSELDEKDLFDTLHRTKAFRKLGKFLKEERK